MPGIRDRRLALAICIAHAESSRIVYSDIIENSANILRQQIDAKGSLDRYKFLPQRQFAGPVGQWLQVHCRFVRFIAANQPDGAFQQLAFHRVICSDER